jgi:hypothetical protein
VKALIAERDTARGMVSERDEKIRAHADAIEDLKRRANAKMGEFDANLQVAVKERDEARSIVVARDEEMARTLRERDDARQIVLQRDGELQAARERLARGLELSVAL